MWALVGTGLAAMVVLAVVIGRAIDRQARDEAWARIADSRRRNTERARELDEVAATFEAREYGLELRERRLDVREDVLLRREALLEEIERRIDPPA